ncbi:histidine kinase [Actinomyces minihominis]|uniref:histidine kinase n=1 Tax=Actinomyces minihominis TaxID=2002838 RepID=UPI00101AE35C|nr:histidine kinase [Actinomyces minihominis]
MREISDVTVVSIVSKKATGPSLGVRSELRRGLKRSLIFAGAALGLLLFEFVSDWSLSRVPSLEDFFFALALTAGLIAFAVWPRFGGLLYLVIAVAEGIVWSGVVLPYLGLYIVVADWISRRWYLAALIAWLAVEGTHYARRPGPLTASTLIETGFLTMCSIIIGAAALWYRSRVGELQAEVVSTRKEIEEAEASVRVRLSRGLHDTVARDLVRLLVACQNATTESVGDSATDSLNKIEYLARQSLKNLRRLMEAPSNKTAAPNLRSTIDTCQRMLAGRKIVLASTLPEVTDLAASPEQLEAIELAVQEGSLNVLKYGRENSISELNIEADESGHLELTLSSLTEPDRLCQPELAGGFGLANLRSRIETTGGRLLAGPVGDKWLLAVSFARLEHGPVSERTTASEEGMSSRAQ